MKAIERNNIIEIHKEIPKVWVLENGERINGFRSSTEEFLYSLGFRDFIEPTITEFQKYGDPIKDEENDVFTYDVLEKTTEEYSTELEVEKNNLIKLFEDNTDALIIQVVGERANEYEIAEQEAKAFKQAGFPNDNVPFSVSSDAEANGYSAQIACDIILQMADNWRNVQMALRAQRLMSKAEVKNSTTLAKIKTVKQTWEEFLNNVKQQIIG